MSKLSFKQLSNISKSICSNTNLILRLLEEFGEINYYSFYLDEVEILPDYLLCNSKEKNIIKYHFNQNTGITLILSNYPVVVNISSVLVRLSTTDSDLFSKLQKAISSLVNDWNLLGQYVLDSINKGAVA